MSDVPEKNSVGHGLKPEECTLGPEEISDEDILNAMKEMEGYLDITPGDFKESYRHA